MKEYEDEESPWDDMLKGTKSYKEILERVQKLLSDLQAIFRTFQRHRGRNLPQVLQGEEVTLPQEKESVPLGFEQETEKKGNPKKASQDKERPPQNKNTEA